MSLPYKCKCPVCEKEHVAWLAFKDGKDHADEQPIPLPCGEHIFPYCQRCIRPPKRAKYPSVTRTAKGWLCEACLRELYPDQLAKLEEMKRGQAEAIEKFNALHRKREGDAL